MMKIMLNRKQIGKLNEIILHFPEIDKFTIETDNSSVIGTGVCVRFNLFGEADTKISITEEKNK